jgi:RHS repeat-associated protein
MRLDGLTGLYDDAARYYQAGTGRFVSTDDARFTGGAGNLANANLYVYCGNNPVDHSDLNGHDFSIAEISIAASFQNIVSASYGAAAQGVMIAAQAVSANLTFGQAFWMLIKQQALGLVLGFAYFKALGAVAEFPESLPSGDVSADLEQAESETLVPGAKGTGSVSVPTSILQDAMNNEAALNDLVAERMEEVGVPPDMIGNVQNPYEGPGAFVVRDPAVGGTNALPGLPKAISVDTGVFLDNLVNTPSWRSASLEDRIDAVIAHEYTEVNTPPSLYEGTGDIGKQIEIRHNWSLMNASETPLNISDNARQLLREMAQSGAQ